MIISNTGCWQSKNPHDYHYFDKDLCNSLINFFKKEKAKNVVDFGCGLGDYVKYFSLNKIESKGYDGNKYTNKFNNLCDTLDLSQSININKYSWVISFEVGEHIPNEYEDVFINNMHNHNYDGIILTWAAEGQIGMGHVNCKNYDYIKEKIIKKGYSLDSESTKHLKNSCRLLWLKNNLMVFRKNKNNDSQTF